MFRFAVCVFCIACSGPSTNDAGVDAGGDTDAGKGDGGMDPDAGRDAGTDGGRSFDAGELGACDVGAPCAIGICTGAGCESPDWSCSPADDCAADEVTYCGCDGNEFTDSSTCPRRPYTHIGACATTPVSCDPREVFCFETVVPCREGMAREVRDNCWGDCVRLDRCTCTEDDACPFGGEESRCTTGRCVAID
jgi:hypothetical protein